MTPATAALPDLLTPIRSLSRTDKLRVIELLAGDLARVETPLLLEPSDSYEVLTPMDTFDAAAVLLRELDKVQAGPGQDLE